MASETHPVVNAAGNTSPSPRRLIAYRISGVPSYLKLIPAAADRFWMDFTTGGWANRCLPLRIANQAGWMVLNDADFEVTWTGNNQLDGLKITFKKGQESSFVRSMFGYGVVTWAIPYLFRTPPGFNLLVRGPVNTPKDGVAPLDGIVESDWLPYPFTMNWKITRPQKAVKFERDEPICMIMPVRREDVESFQPEMRNLESEPEIYQNYQTWRDRRAALVQSLKDKPRDGGNNPTEGHYIRGESGSGERVSEHQTKLEIKAFTELEPAVTPPPLPGGAPVQQAPSLLRRLLRR